MEYYRYKFPNQSIRTSQNMDSRPLQLRENVMELTKVSFKVSMDDEQRKLGNAKVVEFQVDFSETSQNTLKTLAIASQNIRWQAQIKGHWTEFTEGKLPKVVKFGEPLFGTSRTRQVVITQESALNHLKSISRLEQVRSIISMMESTKMDVPINLYEEEETLTIAKADKEASDKMMAE